MKKNSYLFFVSFLFLFCCLSVSFLPRTYLLFAFSLSVLLPLSPFSPLPAPYLSRFAFLSVFQVVGRAFCPTVSSAFSSIKSVSFLLNKCVVDIHASCAGRLTSQGKVLRLLFVSFCLFFVSFVSPFASLFVSVSAFFLSRFPLLLRFFFALFCRLRVSSFLQITAIPVQASGSDTVSFVSLFAFFFVFLSISVSALRLFPFFSFLFPFVSFSFLFNPSLCLRDCLLFASFLSSSSSSRPRKPLPLTLPPFT